MYQLNRTLLYFLAFTIISSALAYNIVIRAYDGVFETAFQASLIEK